MNLPMCDVCKHEVDSLRTYYDHLLRVTVFTVYCHGKSERMELADRTVVDSNSIGPGIAFKEAVTRCVVDPIDTLLAKASLEVSK